jgi:subtilisin family serine protease
VVAQGGFHVTAGGTSASSPVVAGLVALYLQRHPTATNQQIKQAIINCAYQDVYTGSALPNNKWGYGKLDGFATMWCGENIIGVKEITNQESIEVYPNPNYKRNNRFVSKFNIQKLLNYIMHRDNWYLKIPVKPQIIR